MNLTEINSIKDQVAQNHGYSSFSAAIYATCMKSDSSIIDSIVSEAMHLYAESQKPKWISIKDELPETPLNTFLVTLENNCVMEMHFSNIGKPKWFKLGVGFETEDNPVTNWQPLPEAPLATEE